MRRSTEQPAGTVTTVPAEEMNSVVSRFDEEIAGLTVIERNDQRLIKELMERTIDWYERNVIGRGGGALIPHQRAEVNAILEGEAPGAIAKRTADQLVFDLNHLEKEMVTSGLGVREERRLTSEIDGLRRSLLRDGHYHREFDDAVVRIAYVVKTASGAWAESHLRIIEQYLARDRWWLR